MTTDNVISFDLRRAGRRGPLTPFAAQPRRRSAPPLPGYLASEDPDALDLAWSVLRESNRARGKVVLLMVSVAFLLGALVRGGVHRG